LRAEVAALPQGRVAIFERDEMIIELQYLVLDDELDIDGNGWDLFMDTIRQIDQSLDS
jgi:hypothetical protein